MCLTKRKGVWIVLIPKLQFWVNFAASPIIKHQFMKYRFLIFTVVLAACNSNTDSTTETTAAQDTVNVQPANVTEVEVEDSTASVPESPVYENERFKEVTVQKTGEYTFQIKGKAQIFEASFSWVVEDGHQELKTGHEMTDAGAPEWGNFQFTVDVKKARENSTLMLILFESSPKDGSRQHELPVLLY